MMTTTPVESFGELVDRFPGIDELDPKALGRFAFYASSQNAPYEGLYNHDRSEPYEEWHSGVTGVLRTVEDWKEGLEGNTSRAEIVARIMHNRREDMKVERLANTLLEASPDEGMRATVEYLQEGGYRIATKLGSSPLFPEGRIQYSSLDEVKDDQTGHLHIPYGSEIVDADDNVLDKEIEDYLKDGHSRKESEESIRRVLAELGTIDMAQFEDLRTIYGSKAAGLICFNEKASAFNELAKELMASITVEVPPFIPVSVGVYEAWLADRTSIGEVIETLRVDAIGLTHSNPGSRDGNLVVIRSSAVKSEDGDEHTGAGVYKSLAVDPKDVMAFREAIEEVYKSTRGEAAWSYQQSIGVTDERMGLVIQQYIESNKMGMRGDTYYGHANGSGVNPNLIEVNTNAGSLLYDKPAISAKLLVNSNDMHSNVYLHSKPDRDSSLRKAVDQTDAIPHTVALAERLFGKPMQVEFVNNAVVQVRPLILNIPETIVSFPENMAPLVECAGVGVGDMELEPLDSRDDNSEKTGFVVFYKEYGFTISGAHNRYSAFPKEGAVILLGPSSSGHIQAICREKGLLCFYPKSPDAADRLEDAIEDRDGGTYSNPATSNARFRFVSDGYVGTLYAAQ